MPRFAKTLLAAAFLAVAALAMPAGAGDPVAVIVNRDNPVEEMNANGIKRIYTNSVLSWPDGTPITIYDLDIRDPLRESFSGQILGKTPGKVAEEWAHLKITNQAKNPPQTVKSEALIIRRVSREKGAIGYVSLGLVRGNRDVRVVNTLR